MRNPQIAPLNRPAPGLTAVQGLQPDTPIIEVPMPPFLAWMAAQQLQRAGIPCEQLPDGTIRTLEAGVPILDALLAQHGQPQQARGLAGWDLLRRQKQNRRTLTDAIGFILSLAAVVAILTQSGPWSARLGLGDAGRAVLILVAGLVLTLFVSEIVIGKGDPRRWMFVSGMMGLFIAGAMWFIGKSMGVF